MMPDYKTNISRRGISIYDPVTMGDPELWIPGPELETILDTALRGRNLAGLPLRTRSKVVKELICEALGYPVPLSFRKTRPRFPGQQFDTYVQKSNNLQIWNEEIVPARRYVLIRVSSDDVIERVKVIDGETLSLLDTTGTLTQKYQARLVVGNETAELVSPEDTANLREHLQVREAVPQFWTPPTAEPEAENLFPIRQIFERLSPLIGARFPDTGADQERNRGGVLHQLVCKALGYLVHMDDGRFPDVRHQLLEVKLQTSPTIDLGLVRPDSQEPLDVPQIRGRQIRHCDVRYAVFYGRTSGTEVQLTHLIVTSGQDFFARFQQFQGRVINRKLQIRLPANFFER